MLNAEEKNSVHFHYSVFFLYWNHMATGLIYHNMTQYKNIFQISVVFIPRQSYI